MNKAKPTTTKTRHPWAGEKAKIHLVTIMPSGRKLYGLKVGSRVYATRWDSPCELVEIAHRYMLDVSVDL